MYKLVLKNKTLKRCVLKETNEGIQIKYLPVFQARLTRIGGGGGGGHVTDRLKRGCGRAGKERDLKGPKNGHNACVPSELFDHQKTPVFWTRSPVEWSTTQFELWYGMSLHVEFIFTTRRPLVCGPLQA
jgi:hypothetical protein